MPPPVCRTPRPGGTQVLEGFRTQPVIAALLDHPDVEDLVGGDPVARFGDDLDTLVREAVDEALPTNALLTLGGRRLAIAGTERRRYFNEYLDAPGRRRLRRRPCESWRHRACTVARRRRPGRGWVNGTGGVFVQV